MKVYNKIYIERVTKKYKDFEKYVENRVKQELRENGELDYMIDEYILQLYNARSMPMYLPQGLKFCLRDITKNATQCELLFDIEWYQLKKNKRVMNKTIIRLVDNFIELTNN